MTMRMKMWKRTAVIAGLLLAFGAESAAADQRAVITELEGDPAATLDYWTPERMRTAVEVEPPPAPPSIAKQGNRTASTAAKPPDFEVPAGFEKLAPYRVHGRIFMVLNGGNSSCSATVVTSFALNLATTAAHCLYDNKLTGAFATNVVFVPGYRDGARPFGTWVASSLGVSSSWREGFRSGDFGVVNLLPNAAGSQIQSLLGSRGITFNRPIRRHLGEVVDILGYGVNPAPFYNGERLIECDATIVQTAAISGLVAQPCNQQHGSSGGGWIQNGLLSAVVSIGGCGPVLVGCDKMIGTYLGTEAFELWSAAAGGVPNSVRKRMKKCKKRKKRAKRQRCLNRAQTFQPTGF